MSENRQKLPFGLGFVSSAPTSREASLPKLSFSAQTGTAHERVVLREIKAERKALRDPRDQGCCQDSWSFCETGGRNGCQGATRISCWLFSWGGWHVLYSNSHICGRLKLAFSRGKGIPQKKAFSGFLCSPSMYTYGKMLSETW